MKCLFTIILQYATDMPSLGELESTFIGEKRFLLSFQSLVGNFTSVQIIACNVDNCTVLNQLSGYLENGFSLSFIVEPHTDYYLAIKQDETEIIRQKINTDKANGMH
jgi:hypothetical protein